MQNTPTNRNFILLFTFADTTMRKNEIQEENTEDKLLAGVIKSQMLKARFVIYAICSQEPASELLECSRSPLEDLETQKLK